MNSSPPEPPEPRKPAEPSHPPEPRGSRASGPRPRRRGAVRVLGALCCLLPLAACGGGGVTPPHPTGAAARDCRALAKLLPSTLHGLARHDPSPASDFTAAWGSPAVVLRCGVPRPAMLTPGSGHYDANVQAVPFGGVQWLWETVDKTGARMTTTDRAAYVEVTLPAHYTGRADSTDSLTTLGGLIRKTVPAALN